VATGQEDGQLRAKLHHLHLVQWAYLHIWRSERVKPRELTAFPTMLAIRAWVREYYDQLPAYLAGVSSGQPMEMVRFPWADHLVQRFGKAQPATWSDSVLQLAMHSAYHRGQVARRLRELGEEPPLTDFIAWVWAGRPEADWGGEDAA
jgi:uncharacterized damage-inducible protein DinB